MTPADRAADAYAEQVEHARVAVAEEQVASQAAYDDHLRAAAIRDVDALMVRRGNLRQYLHSVANDIEAWEAAIRDIDLTLASIPD